MRIKRMQLTRPSVALQSWHLTPERRSVVAVGRTADGAGPRS
jgi:hypothetical protein